MRKFSQQAAANFVPILARLILFLAFVPVGWHHAMNFGHFTGDGAARLAELGVIASAGEPGISSVGLATQDFAPAGAGQARALHELTLIFDALRLPKPQAWAWTVAVFELVGGTLILIGLFSRVWSGGLALWTLGLIALSAPTLAESWSALWSTTDPASVLPRALALSQLGLFALASGLALTGPGRLSLDGLIFRGRGPDEAEAEAE